MEIDSFVDIAFDCLPLRSVGRLDVPLDASETLGRRLERIKSAIEAFGAKRTYFLYNARCVFRFANSEVDGICRLEFEGIVRTDAGDRLCEQTLIDVTMASDTCGGVPTEVERWLADRVRQAVAIEFDRFIAAGQLAAPAADDESAGGLSDVSRLAGLDV